VSGTNPVVRTLLVVLIALAITAVAALGLHFAYPSPSQPVAELKKLDEQQKALDASRALTDPTGKTPGMASKRKGEAMTNKHDAYYQKLVDDIAKKRVALEAQLQMWLRIWLAVVAVLAAIAFASGWLLLTRAMLWAQGLLVGAVTLLAYGTVEAFRTGGAVTGAVMLTLTLLTAAAVGYAVVAHAGRNAGAGREPGRHGAEPAPGTE
jgi:hypothetical protein